MHYERAPCFRRLKQTVRRHLRSAALRKASLRYGGASGSSRDGSDGEEYFGKEIKVGRFWEPWHFTLRERLR